MSNLPELNKRIFEIIKDTTGGNVLDFARNIGVAQQKLDRLNKPDTRNNKIPRPTDEVIHSILKGVPKLNRVWLLTGVGDKYLNQKTDDKIELESNPMYSMLIDEIKELKKEIQNQKDNNQELLKTLIDYLDKKIEPMYVYMTEMNKKREKENI